MPRLSSYEAAEYSALEGDKLVTRRCRHQWMDKECKDGRHIAFFTDRNGKWELYVMDADGSNQRPMFETALDGLEFEYGFVAERMVSWTE